MPFLQNISALNPSEKTSIYLNDWMILIVKVIKLYFPFFSFQQSQFNSLLDKPVFISIRVILTIYKFWEP